MNIEESMKYIREKLQKAKKPFLFHDSDCDGTFSYFQLKNFNKKLEGLSISKSLEVQMYEVKALNEQHDLILFFDTPHIEEDMIKEIKEITNAEIILVDHHINQLDDLVKKYNIYYFNPIKINKKDSRPSCYWAYRVTQLKENLPLVTLGSVSDFFLLEVLEELKKENTQSFNLLINSEESKQNEILDFINKYSFNDETSQEQRTNYIQSLWYETNLGKIRGLIDFIYKMPREGLRERVNLIYKESLTDLLALINAAQGEPYEDYSLFQKKSKKFIQKAVEKNKDREFAIFEHRGKTSYNRQLAEEILYHLPKAKYAWLIFRKMDSDFVSCSFRARAPYIVNDIITNSLKGLEGQGGGHPQSGGCGIKKKDFDTFAQRFETEVKKRLLI